VPYRLLAAGLAVLGIAVPLCAGCAGGPRVAECPMSPCQGWVTAEEIARMPILERPDRPGHIFGNTIRRVYRWQTDQPEPAECP